MTYFDECRRLQAEFEASGVPESAIDARYLIEFVADFSEAEYLLNRDLQMPSEQLMRLNELASRRKLREPLQYILGSQEFMGLPFICTKDCLIPRQDTEILAEHAMKAIEERRKHGIEPRVIDLCTGSGCVIISISALCGLKEPEGADISAAALDVARRNAELNDVQLRLTESDLFTNISGSYDIITANPPYIDTGMIHGLIPEIWEYEPMIALDGGADGLYFYRKIVEEAPKYLKPDGHLLFEIGDTQGSSVAAIMEEGGFTDVSVHRDLAEMTRVVKGRKRL